MAVHNKKETRENRRYARRSTKRHTPFRLPLSPKRFWMTVGIIPVAAAAVIAVALLWGSRLKARSDAYREAEAAGAWTLDEAVAEPIPVSVPTLRAVSVEAGESMGDILIDGIYEGVMLPLYDGGFPLSYAYRTAGEAGLTVADGAPSLTDEVTRIGGRGLYVMGTFTVTCLHEDDPATAAYRRGLELALLRECAEAGVDDILLLGLPAGDDAADARSVAFLEELNALLSDLSTRPAIGAALSPTVFAGEEDQPAAESADSDGHTVSLYAGALAPGRVRKVCDYLVMDLRDLSAEETASLLPSIQYAYVRHSLRLLMPEGSSAVEEALARKFERIFEMAW